MRNQAPRLENLSPTEQGDDSAGRSRNQSSSLDSSVDRDILNGRSISPLEKTPDRIPQPGTSDTPQPLKRRTPWYFDGFSPMKPIMKKQLRRRKLKKELDQLIDRSDIDEGPPPSKIAYSRTRFSEQKKNEEKKLEKLKAKEKVDALKQIFRITEF